MDTGILTQPITLVSALVILGSVIVALRMTRPGRVARFKSPLRRSKRSDGPVEATAGPAADEGEGAFQVERAQPGQDTVTFADVAGLDDAIAELQEVAEYLASPERFRALGAELPRGVLLYGLPGCGKTLLARALAGETGVPFFFVSASSFVEKFVGTGAARVRKLFESAKRQAPCIVFIDELDAIGRHRTSEGTGDREFDHTLNQLLVELDGFLGSTGVLILGATNRPELIDPALLRPGRFDRRIRIERPDVVGREKILRLHAERRPMSRRVDWASVAADTAGLSAAELASIVNESCLLAARRHRDRVTQDDVDEAMSRVLSGTQGSGTVMTEDEKELVATHESGHAVLSILLRGVEPPPRISILSRANAFGRSPWSSTEDREVTTKRELMAQLMVLMGGRGAEINAFGQPSTRSEDDIEHAANLARRMVERLAMTGRFDLADTGGGGRRGDKEDSNSSREVRELLVRAEQAARTILRDNEAIVRLVAAELLERETLTATELVAVVDRAGPPVVSGQTA